MLDHNAAQAAYERLKQRWMLEPGYTLADMEKDLKDLQKEVPELGLDADINDWEFAFGIGSGVWPFSQEFLENERQKWRAANDDQQ